MSKAKSSATKKAVKVVKKEGKKVTAKKELPAKSAVTARPAAKLTAIKEPMTKVQIMLALMERTELTKKQVQSVLDSLSQLIEQHLKKNAAGEFTLPGLLKVQIKKKPATKERKGINPFTKQEMVFQAKPASNTVRIRPLKKLKDMAV